MLTIPPYPKYLSLVTLLFGISLFFWMSTEDSVWLVSLFGLGLSVLLAAHGVFRLKGKTFRMRVWIPLAVGLGALVGAGTAVGTVLLMVIKTAWHNHVFPDYPFPLIAGIVERLPAWTVAGALVGLAFVILWGMGRSRY